MANPDKEMLLGMVDNFPSRSYRRKIMKVILAGYNVDKEVIDELKRHSPPREDVTPETLSASYARISRDPRPANVLRAAARREVERARRSNQAIIFKMGHHSVAEHAVFNFDVIGISRLAVEEIEKFRLCSFTEKSQRYIRLGDDYVIPEEIKNAGRQDVFVAMIRAQNFLYHSLYERLKHHFLEKHKEIARDTKNQPILDGWAKEDARYIVSLATEGQLGLTLNARNLELLVRRCASRKLAELQELNRRIYELAKEVAPSIILFTEATDFDAKTYDELEEAAGSLFDEKQSARRQSDAGPGRGGRKANNRGPETGEEAVRLVDFPPDGDDRILAALVHSTTSRPYPSCLAQVKKMAPGLRETLIKTAFRNMEFYDFPLREFEYAELTFALVVSASCFAQLKRHRMATLTRQAYRPELGVTIPPSLQEIGAAPEFLRMIERTNEMHGLLQKDVGQASDYVLTNAHRRRVLLKVNVRELYHVSRLREDPTAQWEIRDFAGQMTKLAREVMPLSCLLLGGKDRYPSLYERVFGGPPKFFPPKYIQ